jgi:hypothetical protein
MDASKRVLSLKRERRKAFIIAFISTQVRV